MMMKIKRAASLIILTLISVGTFAQQQKKATYKFPRWVSEKGYWVVETNLRSPLQHTIHFYTNENILLLTRSLSGVRLNPDKKSVKMRLKKELESAVVAWENKNRPGESKKQDLANANSLL